MNLSDKQHKADPRVYKPRSPVQYASMLGNAHLRQESQSAAEGPLLLYRADIDGLRALAVVAVIFYHARVWPLKGGFIGVDLFFVISGYLIGSIVYREVSSESFSFSEFYVRRARRILPALLVVIGVSAALGLVLLSPSELTVFSKTALATMFASSNMVFAFSQSYFAASSEQSPLLMTWSLGVEEQFYLLLPPILIILFRWRPSRIVWAIAGVCLLSFGLSVWLTSKYPAIAFFVLPTRAWELGLGVLLAMWLARRRAVLNFSPAASNLLAVFGFGLIGCSAVLLNAETKFPGFLASAPVFGALLLLCTEKSFLNRRVLGSAPATFIGKISYSWYLWHWPLLSFARIAADGPLSGRATISIVVISFLCAIISWQFVETPFRRMRSSSNQRILSGYGYAVAGSACALLVLLAVHGWPQRFDSRLARAETLRAAVVHDQCLASYGVSRPLNMPTCVLSQDIRPAVALIGDSHAAALAPALRSLAAEHNYRFVQLTKASCPVLETITRRMPSYPGHARECAEYSTAALNVIVSDKRIVSVVIAGYWSGPFVEENAGMRYVRSAGPDGVVSKAASHGNLQVGIHDTVEMFRRYGKRVTLADETPVFNFDPFRHVVASYIPVRRALSRVVSTNLGIMNDAAPVRDIINLRDSTHVALSQGIAGISGVTLFDSYDSLCRRGQCTFADSGDPYFVDDQHLSSDGAKFTLRSISLDGLFEKHGRAVQQALSEAPAYTLRR